ncbi:MAG: hypothetical protein KDC80_07575 [Saprospiraceae bacterium]|nr:hypothetical protein [Saprospiraceae bacterium]
MTIFNEVANIHHEKVWYQKDPGCIDSTGGDLHSFGALLYVGWLEYCIDAFLLVPDGSGRGIIFTFYFRK